MEMMLASLKPGGWDSRFAQHAREHQDTKKLLHARCVGLEMLFSPLGRVLSGIGAAGCSDFGEFRGATAERNLRGRNSCPQRFQQRGSRSAEPVGRYGPVWRGAIVMCDLLLLMLPALSVKCEKFGRVSVRGNVGGDREGLALVPGELGTARIVVHLNANITVSRHVVPYLSTAVSIVYCPSVQPAAEQPRTILRTSTSPRTLSYPIRGSASQ
jgi:hypothetical protein